MKNFPLSAPTGPGRRSLDVPRPSGGGGRRSIPRRLLLFTCILALASCLAAAAEDTLLGVGYRSVLVSFDPHAGVTLEQHLQLNPHEIFGWLAYDPSHHRLYALARNTENLYWIDTETLQITHVGNLHVESTAPGQVASAMALAYDPSTDTLYTTVAHYEAPSFGNLWSELCSVDPATGALPVCLARINGPVIDALAFGLADGQLHGLALFDPLNKESRAHVVQINTGSGQMESLFQTPYHTVMGLAAGGPACVLYVDQLDIPCLRPDRCPLRDGHPARLIGWCGCHLRDGAQGLPSRVGAAGSRPGAGFLRLRRTRDGRLGSGGASGQGHRKGALLHGHIQLRHDGALPGSWIPTCIRPMA